MTKTLNLVEQEILDNQQSSEDATRLSNNRRPQVVINQYPENGHLLQKDKEKLQRTVPENSLYSEIVRYGRKSFIVGTSMVKGLKVKDLNRNRKNTSVRVRPFSGATVK